MGLGPGSRLDTYEILAPLGAGGMGEVWLARDLRLDRKVALKVLPSHLTEDAGRVARFQQEARAASALNHPNVCTIHALGAADDGRLFIAMEYVDGATLRQLLVNDGRSTPQALDITIQIASALSAAHRAGVIHRDLKPENVMVRADGLVKVLDFGLAKLDPTISVFETAQSTHTYLRTDSGTVMGTIAYMSPEQACAQPVDLRTDIFSLGAVLYEMVTGRQAFAGDSAAVIHDAILNRMPPSALRLNPELPPRLEDIINKTLEKDPELRYQTATELRTDLVRLKRDTDARAAAPPRGVETTAATTGRPRISRRMALTLVVLLTTILTVLGFARDGWKVLLRRPDLKEVQLTTNSSEDPVTTAAISPDGKYIGYADGSGIHLRLIESGETHTVPEPASGSINSLGWFPDGSKLVVSCDGTTSAPPSIWSVSLIGGHSRKLHDDGMEASVSPDALQIAFVGSQRKDIWVMGADGDEPHQVATSSTEDTFHLPSFRGMGGGLSYGRVRLVAGKAGVLTPEVSMESRDRDGRTTVLLADPGLRGAVRLPDGRIIYSIVADPLWNRSASLWETNTDAQTGKPTGKPRRILDWVGNVSLWRFSSTADGTRVAFVKMTPQRDVYVADLAADGHLESPRRLTLDDSEDFPTNWSADSKAVLFSSDRNGNFDIFRQSLDQRTAEAIVSGPEDELGPPAVSPDGAWLYYVVEAKGWRSNLLRRHTIARSPAVGGPHQKVLGPGFHWPHCARAPSTVCVVVEREANHLDVYALDPSQGKGRKIASTETGSSVWSPSALSPDGSHLAVLMPAEGQIRILSLQGDASRDVPIKGRPLDSTAFYWSAEGTGWYLSSTSVARAAGSDLLMVDLNGQVRVLWHQAVPQETGAIPSPDGRHLAITRTTSVSNVWMIKDF